LRGAGVPLGGAPRPVQASMLVVFTCASRPHLGAFPRISHFRGIALGGVPIESGRARWKLAAPSGGAPHHQFFCPADGISPFHCVRFLFCPAGGPPLGAGSPPLAARRDSSGCDPAARSGPGTPRCPHETASPTPQPRAVRRAPAASGAMAVPPAGRNFSTHPKTRLTRLKQDHGEREGGGEIRPAGHKSHFAGACGHRAGVSRWGVAGVVSYEQRGAPARDVPARSHAEAGRRAGLEAQPERPLQARGAEENLHGVENKTSPGHPRHWQRKGLP
jgi:hypothetical protein